MLGVEASPPPPPVDRTLATSVPFERIFSKSRLIVNKEPVRIQKKVNIFVFLNKNLTSS